MNEYPPTGLPEVATKDELAAFLKVSRRHVTNLTRNGIVPSIKLGRSVRYSRASVMIALAAIGQPRAAT